MAKTLQDLANNVEKIAKEIELAASKLAIDVANAIVADLAYTTPVDTSNALSNWIVTLDSPATHEISPHVPGVLGSTQPQSAAETVSLAKATLQNKKPGQPIFITNNAPYIRYLDEGSSSQAPAGFVERTVAIGRQALKGFRLND